MGSGISRDVEPYGTARGLHPPQERDPRLISGSSTNLSIPPYRPIPTFDLDETASRVQEYEQAVPPVSGEPATYT